MLNITATYASPPPAAVQIAPLFANKRVAFCFQKDDGYLDDYTVIYRVLRGGVVNGVTYPGITFDDGTGRRCFAGYSFAINANATAKAANNATLCPYSAYAEMSATGDFEVVNHSLDHNASGGTDYQVTANAAALQAALGYTTRVGVVPASLPDFPRAFIQNGHPFVFSEGFGGDGSPNAAPYSAEVRYGDRIYLNTLATAPYNPARIICSRHNLDTQFVTGLSAVHAWLDLRFADAATYGPSVFTAFSHDIGAANAPFVAQLFDAIGQHPSNAGGNEAWLVSSQNAMEYLEARRLSVVTPAVTGNTLTVAVDQSAIPAASRNRSLSLLLPPGMQAVAVTGADSYSYNAATGLLNLYARAGVSASPGFRLGFRLGRRLA